MTDCMNGELRDLLPELMHGTLDADRTRAVEAHVASCVECAQELALLRVLRTALGAGPAIDVGAISAAVSARVSPARRQPPAPRRTGWRIAIAAAALLAAGGAGYVLRSTHADSERSPIIAMHPDSPRTAVAVPTTVSPAPVHANSVQVAVIPRHVVPPRIQPVKNSVAGGEVLGDLSDLSADDVRALASTLDRLSSVPDSEAGPVIDPLGAPLDDAGKGGT